ncbi:hypothetical protein J2X06_002898 [Lysobacter niastensis]|uniref:Uncharacterized protein n=1 Tax=Lysobacter niastensis TaxID=380629 RepID=A0ABU1WDJ1_9GAMM|nr:hypothetical protein [Lysobacter niastensis]MDR7135689.1 hypothetical protein [Lysobacter niastensis]
MADHRRRQLVEIADAPAVTIGGMADSSTLTRAVASPRLVSRCRRYDRRTRKTACP